MTLTATSPLTVAEIVKAARGNRNVREFGEQLGISHAAISKIERGETEPGKETMAAWFNDERQWVHEMAVEIFVARYRQSLKTLKN